MADDFSDLLRLEADLRAVPGAANPLIQKAIEVTARNVKDDWRQAAERTGLGPYAGDVSYEMKITSGQIEAEVGPTIGDAGSLGFVEDGGARVSSSPQHAARDAKRANEDDFYRGLEIAVFDATVKGLT